MILFYHVDSAKAGRRRLIIMFTLFVPSLGNSFIRHKLHHNRPITVKTHSLGAATHRGSRRGTDCMTFMFHFTIITLQKNDDTNH